MAPAKHLSIICPGEVLVEEFMKPHALSQNRLARDIDVNPARVNDIVHGRSALTAGIALRLAKYFGTTPELWMNLQADYELRRARAKDWPKVERRVRILAAE
jgi:addiction module HigA family antidote